MTKRYKIDELNIDGRSDHTEVLSADQLEKWHPEMHRKFIMDSQTAAVYERHHKYLTVRARRLPDEEVNH